MVATKKSAARCRKLAQVSYLAVFSAIFTCQRQIDPIQKTAFLKNKVSHIPLFYPGAICYFALSLRLQVRIFLDLYNRLSDSVKSFCVLTCNIHLVMGCSDTATLPQLHCCSLRLKSNRRSLTQIPVRFRRRNKFYLCPKMGRVSLNR